jgi:hypothetical protein
MANESLLALITTLLCGKAAAWPDSFDEHRQAEFLQLARRHGVLPLLYDRLRSLKLANQWPGALVEQIASEIRRQTAVEAIRQRELDHVVRLLNQAGIRPLLLKGTALAYSHYPWPALRVRADTDILIPQTAVLHAKKLLQASGYHLPVPLAGLRVNGEFCCVKQDAHGVRHELDVHWKLSNWQLFANIFNYRELAEASVPSHASREPIQQLSPVHALLHACMHLVTPDNAERLIWVYDIHLLISALTPGETKVLINTALEKRLCEVLMHGVMRAREIFDTLLPEVLDQSFALWIKEPMNEPSAGYLRGHRKKYQEFVSNFANQPSWLARAGLIRETMFPPPDYMLNYFGVSNPLWLPLLYLRRGISGLGRYVKKLR